MIRNRKGVTLVELMTAVAIMMVVMLPVSLVFNTGNKTYYIENDTMAAQEEAREAMDEIIESLRENDSQDITIGSKDDDGFSNELIIDNGYLKYTKEGNTIKKKNPTSGDESDICSYVKTFKVKEDTGSYDTKLIEIEIKTQIGKGREIVLQNSYRIKSDDI